MPPPAATETPAGCAARRRWSRRRSPRRPCRPSAMDCAPRLSGRTRASVFPTRSGSRSRRAGTSAEPESSSGQRPRAPSHGRPPKICSLPPAMPGGWQPFPPTRSVPTPSRAISGPARSARALTFSRQRCSPRRTGPTCRMRLPCWTSTTRQAPACRSGSASRSRPIRTSPPKPCTRRSDRQPNSRPTSTS